MTKRGIEIFRGAKIIASLSLLILSLWACREESAEPSLPFAPVILELNLNASAYRTLTTPTSTVHITTPPTEASRIGVGGLAIVHSLSPNTYYAYDLACPVERRGDIKLVEHDLELSCPKCQTVYDVLSGGGYPIRGVGRSPLTKYRTSYEASSKLLRVYN